MARDDVFILFLDIDGDDFEIVGHEFPSRSGRKQAADSASGDLEAVERLLRERKDDLLEHIRVYLDVREVYSPARPGIFRILNVKALSHVGDTYRIRVDFEDRISRTTATYISRAAKIRVLDFLLELDGDRFEIVGHEFPPAL